MSDPHIPLVAPNAICARCGHNGFRHAFGPCDFSRGGERVDDCEGFVATHEQQADPLDLEALKKWAEARKDLAGDLFVNLFGYGGVDRDNFIEICERVYQRGLDHAVQIAEKEQVERKLAHVATKVLDDELAQARQDVLRLRDELDKALRVLYLAYAAGNEMARCGITMDPDWPKIQGEAYEAVGKYLYPGPPQPEPFVMLADTKHYEQHRAQEGEG